MSTTEELIKNARGGDRRALELLLIQHAERLRIHLLRGLPQRVQGRISVEDVVQETLAQAFLKIRRLRGDSERSFVAWLYAIGDMTLIDLVRKDTAQIRGGNFQRKQFAGDSANNSLVDLLGQLPGDSITASRNVAIKEGVAALQVAIASLPDDQRRAVQLHLLQGKSLDETADEMQRTKASVRSLLHRAKEQLADAMGRASNWLSHR
ncbi:MAG: sigma-70 family RNA polymerase sigma factor [Planctomycetales bacterium]|nr:sigma-70 family RNA polymerase sigma factor [Planctomycetales bacterium]